VIRDLARLTQREWIPLNWHGDQGTRSVRVKVVEALAKVPDAFAQGGADLREALGPEDDQREGKDDEELWQMTGEHCDSP
jgi:hypothetical protein